MFSTNPLRRLFGAKPSAPAPSTPPGVTVYAIGDVHGRADLLDILLGGVLEDAERREQRAVVVTLGDYVDRGPRSYDVVEMLLALGDDPRIETHFLRGNHDQSVLEFLFDPSTGPGWCDFGGRDTLLSYGVQPARGRTDTDAWIETSHAFAEALPTAHLEFFRNLELTCEIGDYFFVHAGARPGVPLEDQVEQDLLWIRQPFLDDSRGFGKVVVHGHTPAEAVHADRRRIGIDTGAYATDVLTALRLEGEARALIQTRRLPDRRHTLTSADLPRLHA